MLNSIVTERIQSCFIFSSRNEIIKGFEDNFRVYQGIYNNKSLANAELVKMRKRRTNKHVEHIEIDRVTDRKSLVDVILPSILTPNDSGGIEYFKTERQKRGELGRKTSG